MCDTGTSLQGGSSGDFSRGSKTLRNRAPALAGRTVGEEPAPRPRIAASTPRRDPDPPALGPACRLTREGVETNLAQAYITMGRAGRVKARESALVQLSAERSDKEAV